MSTMPQKQTSSSLDGQETASAVPTAGTAIKINTRDDNHHKDFHAELENTFSKFGNVNSIQSYKRPPLSFMMGDQKVAIVFMENTTDAEKAAAELNGASIGGSTISAELLNDRQLINVQAEKRDHERPPTVVDRLCDKIEDKAFGRKLASGFRVWE